MTDPAGQSALHLAAHGLNYSKFAQKPFKLITILTKFDRHRHEPPKRAQ